MVHRKPGPRDRDRRNSRRWQQTFDDPNATGPREPGPRADEPPRVCDDPITPPNFRESNMSNRRTSCYEGVTRRSFLADTGMGFTGLALGAMLFKDGVARANDAKPTASSIVGPHFTPKAKNVIWIFLCG